MYLAAVAGLLVPGGVGVGGGGVVVVLVLPQVDLGVDAHQHLVHVVIDP